MSKNYFLETDKSIISLENLIHLLFILRKSGTKILVKKDKNLKKKE